MVEKRDPLTGRKRDLQVWESSWITAAESPGSHIRRSLCQLRFQRMKQVIPFEFWMMSVFSCSKIQCRPILEVFGSKGGTKTQNAHRHTHSHIVGVPRVSFSLTFELKKGQDVSNKHKLLVSWVRCTGPGESSSRLIISHKLKTQSIPSWELTYPHRRYG